MKNHLDNGTSDFNIQKAILCPKEYSCIQDHHKSIIESVIRFSFSIGWPKNIPG